MFESDVNFKYSVICCIGLPFCNIVMSKPGSKFSLLEDLVLITVELCQIILEDAWVPNSRQASLVIVNYDSRFPIPLINRSKKFYEMWLVLP